MSKLWGGRFEGQTDALVEAFTESVSFDSQLALYDIQGSIAHAEMLGAQGILTEADVAAIVQGLNEIRTRIEAGDFTWDPALEDVHTNIEAALVERIGDAGKRLHTGRSRNDQIATDIRLWARDRVDAIIGCLRDLCGAFIDFAEAHIDVVLPGCTHLQHAQPVLLAHHMLAYVEMFGRDAERFADLRKRVNVLPLGSAALAGTPYPIDRVRVAQALGFDGITANSMDAVADRDYLIEFCSNAAITMMHLSRLCEELILWLAPAYNFIEIGDAFTTGSSIMPQKKNPDVAELVRGKTGRVYGALTGLLTLMKGLPMTYNRDLQEDKEPVFDTALTIEACLTVVAGMIPTIKVHADRMAEAAKDGFLEATDIADYLVGKGVPFREAHGMVGAMVRYCVERGKRLPELTLDEFRQFAPAIEADIHDQLRLDSVLARRDNPGGTAPNRVRDALKAARKKLE